MAMLRQLRGTPFVHQKRDILDSWRTHAAQYLKNPAVTYPFVGANVDLWLRTVAHTLANHRWQSFGCDSVSVEPDVSVSLNSNQQSIGSKCSVHVS